MDEIFKTAGPWQRSIFILSLLGHMPYGMFVMSMSFMAPKLDYWCKPRMNDSIELHPHPEFEGRCEYQEDNQTLKCTKWEYDHTMHHRTLIEEVGWRVAVVFCYRRTRDANHALMSSSPAWPSSIMTSIRGIIG